MKEYLDLFFRFCNFVFGLGCLVAAIVSFFKGDVMHITLAYFAAGFVYTDLATRNEE